MLSRYSFRSICVAVAIVFQMGLFGCAQENDTANVFQKLNKALAADDKSEALKLLGEALEKDPKNSSLLQIRAETLFRMGRVAESVPDFDKVVEIQPAFRRRIGSGASRYTMLDDTRMGLSNLKSIIELTLTMWKTLFGTFSVWLKLIR